MPLCRYPCLANVASQTLMFLMVDIALFFNQYVNPIALENIGWRYYIVYCVWLLVSNFAPDIPLVADNVKVELIVVYFFYIETRYTPLEEIAKHFDGEDAVVGGAVATEKGKVLAAELGGLDTVDLDKKSYTVEHREL